MRHQALQLQINDPVIDDFYHHFWQVKGGQSRAQELKTKPATISTQRKTLDDKAIGKSLGNAGVHYRAPDVAVRTPKKLLEVPTAAADAPSAAPPTQVAVGGDGADGAPTPTGAAEVGGPPLGGSRWAFREAIDKARSTLIELRVHASTPAVMTPQGQERRAVLLQRLHETCHGGSSQPLGPFNVDLFNLEKGRKLLVDVLPLWPPPIQAATLLSLLRQLPACLQAAPKGDDGASAALAEVSGLAACLASLPKMLPPEQAAKLLDAAVAHGAAPLQQAVERTDFAALLLGLLCTPNLTEAAPAALQAFYAALLPLASAHESPWALLNALLPAASVSHGTMLLRAVSQMSPEAMPPKCREAHASFGPRMQQHLASLG